MIKASRIITKPPAGSVLALLLTFCASTFADQPTATDNPDSTTEGAESLHFITIDVPPWASVNPETGQQEGAFFDIVRAIEARTDYEITTTLTPFARVDRELESGDHDCTILVPRDEDIVAHGAVVALHDIGILSNKDDPIEQYDDLHGKTISLLRGSAISPRFDSDEDIERVYDTDYLIALRKLDRKRIGGIAGAIPTLRYLAETNGLGDMLAPALELTEIPLMFQCSRKSPKLDVMPDINAVIQSLVESGQLEAITEQHHF